MNRPLPTNNGFGGDLRQLLATTLPEPEGSVAWCERPGSQSLATPLPGAVKKGCVERWERSVREAEKDFSSAIVWQGLPGGPYETGDNSV